MTGLEDMRAFVEVVDSGGVNRAALRLGLSKSIISRRIAALERDLGVQLLARSTRGAVPTEAGEEFRQRCEAILADVAAAREAMIGKAGKVTGRLRVTAPQVLGHAVVAPILAELACAHPQLQIDAVFTDRVVDMMSEGFRPGHPHRDSARGQPDPPQDRSEPCGPGGKPGLSGTCGAPPDARRSDGA